MDVRQYLSGKGFSWTEHKRPSGLQAIMNCPFHEDRKQKFAISLDTGAYQCFSKNDCGVQGSWYEFQRQLGDEPVGLNTDKMLSRKKKPEYVRPKVHGQAPGTKAIKYLEGRGLSAPVIAKFRIGVTPDGNTLMFPYLKDGIVVGVKYRAIAEKKMWTEKNTEPVLFNRDNASGSSLVIVEGEIDCLSMAQYGIDCVSVPSGVSDLRWIENEWEWLEQFQRIYLAMDVDDAGQQACEEIATRLGRWRCYKVILPYKDANECLTKKVPVEEIINRMDGAADFSIKDLVSIGYFTEDVLELFRDETKLYGIGTAWKSLDKLLRGWREEELTVWSGTNGSGKSTMLNQVILALATKGQKSCIASLEMPPARLIRWLMFQARGKVGLTDEEIRETIDAFERYIFFVNVRDEIKPKELLNIFEFANRKYGVKHFFVDSLMRVSFDSSNELRDHKQFCSDLVSFSKSYKSHVHLVAHPRKGMSDDDRPGKVDISGTMNISNLAHNVLVLWRPSEEFMEQVEKKGEEIADCYLFVKKNREWGATGKIAFRFDEQTKLFTEWGIA